MLVLPQIKHKNVLYNKMDILERIEKGDGTWQFGFFLYKKAQRNRQFATSQ
jgi:hypothetical protein